MLHYFAQDSPPPSWAGIITAASTLLIALGGIITALSVFVPILRKTKQIEVEVVENQKVNTAKLAVIHTLVNSTLTAALQSELDSSRREEILLREIMSMREDAGHPNTDEQKADLGALSRRTTDLTDALLDRKEQTRVADIQIETERQRVENNTSKEPS